MTKLSTSLNHLLLLSLCVFVLDSFTSSIGGCHLTFTPNIIETIEISEFVHIRLNCSCCSEQDQLVSMGEAAGGQTASSTSRDQWSTDGRFELRASAINQDIAAPSKTRTNRGHRHRKHHEEACATCASVTFPVPQGRTTSFGFYVEGQQVGRTYLKASLIWRNTSETNRQAVELIGAEEPHRADEARIHLLNHTSLSVAVVRKQLVFCTAFDYSAAFIACMTALSVGCCTQLGHLRDEAHRPLALFTGLACQHIVMPLYTFGVTAMIKLETTLAYGLFATATLPGGGLAHLIVFLMEADQPLSTAISILNTVLNIGISPAWLLGLGWYFGLRIRAGTLILWLLPVLLSHLTGILLKHYKPVAADAVMTWFTRPLLLLSAILLVTLGVYINHYAFHYIDYYLVLAVVLTIFGGFCLGGLSGIITKQRKAYRKTLAAETSVFNCLILIPAIRHGLTQPDADLSATVPLWGVFFTPAPIILYFVAHKTKGWTLNFIERRKEKQYRHYSIVSSLAKMAEDVTAVSAKVAQEEQKQLALVSTEQEEKTTSL